MLQKTSHFHARGQPDQRRMGAGRFRRDHRRHQPGDGAEIRHRAEIRQGRDAPRHRSGRRRLPELAPDVSALDRSKLLRKLHDAIMDNQQPLAELLTTEQGKSLAESKGEIAISAAYVLWFAEEARRTYGDVVPSPWKDRRILVTKEPIGVIAAITPWNFPSSMLSRKIAPALAAGCTAVVKPASQTPYSGLAWGVLCEEAGFPKGAVNVVTGSAGEIGDEICSNWLVRKLTFTGSTEVGKLLMAKCAATVKKVSMELGGNAPFIVFDDADIDRAVEGAIVAKYRNSGQTCVCTNRFFVQDGVYDEFVEKLAAASQQAEGRAGPR